MSAAVKTHPIKRTNKVKTYLLSFKRSTPDEIIAEARNRYAAYLDSVNDEDSVLISETAWYRKMSKEMTPAKYLKTYREIAGYSQSKLGELVGAPASRISDYETGQRAISKEMAKKLADVLKTTPAVFI